MTSAATARPAEIPVGDRASVARAYRFLWLAVVFAVLAFGVGANWDRVWHATHPFEDFWSPPHLFIYTTNAIATFLLGRIAFSAELRRHFGELITLPLVSKRMPAALVLAAGGFGVIGLAGVLDSIWHDRFGLDETPWSLPHSMLGSGILLGLLGFVSCRLALAERRPLASWAPALFAVVLTSTTVGVLLGPLDNNNTIESVRAVATLPPLRADPSFQHIVRIYETWDLTRLHPLFVPLSAGALGIGLALARRLVRRKWVFMLVAGIATFLSLSAERREAEFFDLLGNAPNWLPIPYVVPALVVAPFGAGARWAWAAAGLAYGLVASTFWHASGLAVVAAAPLMAYGSAAGERIARIVMRPGDDVKILLLIVGVALPVATGLLDLYLRARTP